MNIYLISCQSCWRPPPLLSVNHWLLDTCHPQVAEIDEDAHRPRENLFTHKMLKCEGQTGAAFRRTRFWFWYLHLHHLQDQVVWVQLSCRPLFSAQSSLHRLPLLPGVPFWPSGIHPPSSSSTADIYSQVCRVLQTGTLESPP